LIGGCRRCEFSSSLFLVGLVIIRMILDSIRTISADSAERPASSLVALTSLRPDSGHKSQIHEYRVSSKISVWINPSGAYVKTKRNNRARKSSRSRMEKLVNVSRNIYFYFYFYRKQMSWL